MTTPSSPTQQATLENPPEGFCWQCPDCPSHATLPENAQWHQHQTGHRHPLLMDLPKASPTQQPPSQPQSPDKAMEIARRICNFMANYPSNTITDLADFIKCNILTPSPSPSAANDVPNDAASVLGKIRELRDQLRSDMPPSNFELSVELSDILASAPAPIAPAGLPTEADVVAHLKTLPEHIAYQRAYAIREFVKWLRTRPAPASVASGEVPKTQWWLPREAAGKEAPLPEVRLYRSPGGRLWHALTNKGHVYLWDNTTETWGKSSWGRMSFTEYEMAMPRHVRVFPEDQKALLEKHPLPPEFWGEAPSQSPPPEQDADAGKKADDFNIDYLHAFARSKKSRNVLIVDRKTLLKIFDQLAAAKARAQELDIQRGNESSHVTALLAKLKDTRSELAIATKKAALADRQPFCADHRDKVGGCPWCVVEILLAACKADCVKRHLGPAADGIEALSRAAAILNLRDKRPLARALVAMSVGIETALTRVDVASARDEAKGTDGAKGDA